MQTPPAQHVLAGRSLSFRGTIAPAEAGHQVLLQRENATGVRFHTVEKGLTAADGSYAITHLFAGTDAGSYRITVPHDAELLGSAGELLTITVAPAARPLSG